MPSSDGQPTPRKTRKRAQTPTDPRARMIAAMLASIGEQGYATTVVADVIARAVASRKTFYEHFEDKHACFFAMSEEIAREWVARVERDEDRSKDPPSTIEARVNDLFAMALESPAAWRVLAV